MNHLDFLREGLRNIKTVGTITRSSKALCKKMTEPVNFDKARIIVEYGAGDGVITKHILSQMHKEARLLAFEVNQVFYPKLREIKDERLDLVFESAEDISSVLSNYDLDSVDCIISAIPFVNLTEELSFKILNNAKKVLKSNGTFIQMHYSLLERKMYKSIFGNLQINFEPLNIPPAFVFVCTKTN